MKAQYQITVAGMGYVGLSLAVLLAQDQKVNIYEINDEKVKSFQAGKAPIKDREIEEYLNTRSLNINACTDAETAFQNTDMVIVATPTNYDLATNRFDTSTIEDVFGLVKRYVPDVPVIIKSTIPIGYTKMAKANYGINALFSPEFLREGRALYDNLYPSRIVVGMAGSSPEEQKSATLFAQLLQKGAKKKDVPILFTGSSEAEAIKLFSNAYLAMRVAYFNELDTYAKMSGLNARQLIEGVSLDPRIGTHYNNPSFGYGGYCLPKDTKQLCINYGDIPQDLVGAIVRSNATRKAFIASDVEKMKPNIVGAYRLIMKSGSDNFRESSILDVLLLLKKRGISVVVYEPMLLQESYREIPVINNLAEFKKMSDVILCNRIDTQLEDVKDKLYTRDIFHVE